MKMRLYFLLLTVFLLAASTQLQAQKKPDAPLDQKSIQEMQYQDSLANMERRLQLVGESMINSVGEKERIDALKEYIPLLVKTMRIPGSINYPFDSLMFMRKMNAPDNSFRLYNWVLKFSDGTFRYYGVIHMNDEQNFKIFPLQDYSSKTDTNPEVITMQPDRWYGALYLKMNMMTYKKKTYYMLYGWDGNQHMSDKRIIEVLSFENGQPVFGAPIFLDKDDRLKTRVIYEFKEGVPMQTNYIAEHNIIILDHLVPPDPASEGFLFTYVPDGTYDYWEWKKGKWIFKEGLFENFKKPIQEAGDYDHMLEDAPKAKTEEEMLKRPKP